MRELHVHNFSTLREATYRSKEFSLIIGPQASGKSLLMKLMYFFESITNSVNEALTELVSFDDFKIRNRARFLRYFPPSAWGNDRFSISYWGKSGAFRVALHTKSNEDVIIYYPKGFEEQYNNNRERLQKHQGFLDWGHESSGLPFISRNISDGEFSNSVNIYIPAGRAFFTNVQTNAFRFLADGELLDPFIVNFGLRLENALSSNAFLSEFNNDHSMVSGLLGGKVVRKNARLTLHANDGRKIPIGTTSSGQQEIFPLIFLLNHSLFRARLAKKRRAPRVDYNIFIEEPEAHLFPEAQKRMVEYIAMCFNQLRENAPGSRMHITTHSPYILTSINNLLLAGQIFPGLNEKSKLEFANKFSNLPLLDAKRMSGYQIDKTNGSMHSIIDKDTKLLNASYIDQVSHEINMNFEEILNA